MTESGDTKTRENLSGDGFHRLCTQKDRSTPPQNSRFGLWGGTRVEQGVGDTTPLQPLLHIKTDGSVTGSKSEGGKPVARPGLVVPATTTHWGEVDYSQLGGDQEGDGAGKFPTQSTGREEGGGGQPPGQTENRRVVGRKLEINWGGGARKEESLGNPPRLFKFPF